MIYTCLAVAAACALARAMRDGFEDGLYYAGIAAILSVLLYWQNSFVMTPLTISILKLVLAVVGTGLAVIWAGEATKEDCSVLVQSTVTSMLICLILAIGGVYFAY